MREERLTVEDVKWHIRDAFDALKERCGKGSALQEAKDSEAVVMAFLAQAEANDKGLEKAREVCKMLVEFDDDVRLSNYVRVVVMARDMAKP